MKRRFLVALAFLLPFYSQAQDAPQAKEVFYVSGPLGTYKKYKSKSEVKAEASQETTDQKAVHISALLGYSSLDEEKFSLNTEISYGLRLGFLSKNHYSLGIRAQHYSTSSELDLGNVYGGLTPSQLKLANDDNLVLRDLTFTFVNLMAEFNYYVNEVDEDGFWFGALIGITKVKLEHPSPLITGEDKDKPSFGVSVGYHFMITPHFSIDPQITYVRIDPGEFHESFTHLSGLINFTLWR